MVKIWLEHNVFGYYRHKRTLPLDASDLVALVRQEGFPLTIVVDKDGIVRYAKTGASEENQAQTVAVIEELSG